MMNRTINERIVEALNSDNENMREMGKFLDGFLYALEFSNMEMFRHNDYESWAEAIENELRRLDGDVSELEDTIEELQQENNRLTNQLNGINVMMSDYTKRALNSAFTAQIVDLNETVTELQRENKNLERRLGEAIVERDHLESQLNMWATLNASPDVLNRR